MDATIWVVAVVGVVLVLGLFVVPWVRLDRAPVQVPKNTGERGLAVVQGKPGCERCQHFDLEHGQRTMQRHAPFWLAAQHVTPSEMAVATRPTCDNPEYLRVRDELAKAVEEEAPDEVIAMLSEELDRLNPQVIDQRAIPVDSQVERLTWASFGTCFKHRELRAKTDACEEFQCSDA